MGVGSLRSSITLSVFLHFLFAAACVFLLAQRTQDSVRRTTFIELQPLPSDSAKKQAERNRKLEAENQERLRQQIVQTSKGRTIQKPMDDSLLGERNQVVDRQTVSRDRAIVMGQDAAKVKHSAKSPAPREESKKKDKLAKQSRTGPLSSFGLPILPTQRADRHIAESLAEEESHWGVPNRAPQDYVKGLRESDRTALNTREFVFYGYYQRIRERLDRAWVPILREKLVRYYKSGRQLASDMEHTTKLMVILNPSGEIVKVRLLGESGTQDLDEAAIKAFNRAGPFPNPPKGIVGGNGEIEIPWEFVLRT